jgi:hypothetical protein
MEYEGEAGCGKLILARKGHSSVRTRIGFADTVSVSDHRRLRKLLELTCSGGALHTDSNWVFGLVDGDALLGGEDIFEVRFLGHHHWEIWHAGRVLTGVRFGKPYLPSPIGYESKLRQELPTLFPAITDGAKDLLVSLVNQAEQERHRTLLVISSEAANESFRLKGQATLIKPCPLTPELLGHLTGIDGAVLVDSSGCCHAIGVILDGLATPRGNPARGARFNSAVRYVEGLPRRGSPQWRWWYQRTEVWTLSRTSAPDLRDFRLFVRCHRGDVR